MEFRILSRVIVITVSLGALLLGCAGNSSIGEASGKMSPAASSGNVAQKMALDTAPQLTDTVTEWNQYAVNFALLPASNLAPIQQTRVMAIVQVSIHDAINGIT